MFAVGFMIAMVTLLKGLKHVGIELDFSFESKFANAIPAAIVLGIIVVLIDKYFLKGIKDTPIDFSVNRFANVEEIFAVLMVFTACAMAFDPIAAVVGVISSGGDVVAKSAMPP